MKVVVGPMEVDKFVLWQCWLPRCGIESAVGPDVYETPKPIKFRGCSESAVLSIDWLCIIHVWQLRAGNCPSIMRPGWSIRAFVHAAGGAPCVDWVPVSVRCPPGSEHCTEAAGQGCSVSSQPACRAEQPLSVGCSGDHSRQALVSQCV